MLYAIIFHLSRKDFSSTVSNMKKIMILLCILSALVIGALWGIKMMLMPVLTGTLNTFVKNVNTPYLTVRFDKAEDTCWFRPCLQIQNLYVRFLDKEFHGGTISVEVLYKWPVSVQIKSLDTHPSDITVNATLSENVLNVQNLNLKSGDLSADLNGWYDTTTHQFSADMDTQNLARFLKPYIPRNMDFISGLFLSDSMKNMKVQTRDGWLTIGGFPVFPMDMNTLNRFLNQNTDTGNFSHSTPHLNLNELSSLLGNMLK